MTRPDHADPGETGDVSRETQQFPQLPATVTSAAERKGYERAASRAAAAFNWTVASAIRDLTAAHTRAHGHQTTELALSWQTYDHRVHLAASVYLRAITQAYNTAVNLGSHP